ncbi:hypothetical protein VTJ49DRAFT_318 [Mycothermus thermophilus]|uniref:Uncharacterized protein n=1 Tax=Humicola insolens TaxID=85995 RepID=A0ABR3VHK3_HUMIN
MTTFSDAAQFDRDLRAARTEWKHHKDHAVKWAHGARPIAGVWLDWNGEIGPFCRAPESMLAKARPCRNPRSEYHGIHPQNIVKLPRRGQWYTPLVRQRVASDVLVEMQDATSTFMPRRSGNFNSNTLSSPTRIRSNSMSSSLSALSPTSTSIPDPFIYSFDRTESPNRPLTLEVFVKPSSGNKRHGGRGGGETERLVEREYEVVDENGEALRGRKVRAVLRKEEKGRRERKGENGGGAEEEGWEEDEGFALI